MNREEYLQAKKAIRAEIDILRNTSLSLDKEYIEENKIFSVGDKLKITDRKGDRIAIVTGNTVDSWGGIDPTLNKVKKDGTTSSVSDHAWNGSTVTKL